MSYRVDRQLMENRKDPRIFCDHDDLSYRSRWNNAGNNRFNGAFYYSKEIVKNIMPRVKTERRWVTINVYGKACDRAIVFIHNNLNPENYEWLRRFDDLILVCGIPETVEKMAHLGHAVYLPLSVDVNEVKRFCVPYKTRDVAFVGRKAKRADVEFPEGTAYLEGLPRTKLLPAMAEFRKVYAVGRTAIEAKILGCEVLPYDPRFPDPSRWQVIDNAVAAGILQDLIYKVDGWRL